MMKKTITKRINKVCSEVFEALRDPQYTNFALLAVNYQGIKTNAIITINEDEDGAFKLQPLFIQVTNSMMKDLKCPDGRIPDKT